MKIGIVPSIVEKYKNQFEYSCDIRLIKFLKKVYKTNSIEILSFNHKLSKKYKLIVISGANGNDLIKFNKEELVVNGLEQIHLFFPSEIVLDTLLNANIAGTIDLFSSSNKSGIMAGRFLLSPDPKNNPFLQNLNQNHKQSVTH